MREQRGSLARIADTIAGTVRRRQRQRERGPRVLLYDAAGRSRLVPPGGEAHADLVETAERLVDLASGDGEDPA